MMDQRPTFQPVFALWPMVTFLYLIIFKNTLIGSFAWTFSNIMTQTALLLLLFILSKKRQVFFLQQAQTWVVILLIVYQWLDTCVFLSLHERLTFDNFISNYKYYNIISYFISVKLVIFTLITLFLPILLRKKEVAGRYLGRWVMLSDYRALFLVFFMLYLGYDVSIFDNEAGAIHVANTNLFVKHVTKDTLKIAQTQYPSLVTSVHNYLDGHQWQKGMAKTNANSAKPNIIIVISESLSMVDSQYSGGLFHRLPKIDKILEDGLTFTHAVANGKITSHGLAASLLGIQTTIIAGFSSMMDSYSPEIFPGNNLIHYAKENGYTTIIISPGQPPYFYGMEAWFKALGFNTIYDINSDVFKSAPRFTWGAPSDRAMYQVAENLIPQLKQPYMLVIQTVSLHQPYILPDNKYRLGDNDLLNLINYVDNTTYNFYEAIKKMDFTKNGYFVIYGDHRRFEPLEPEELADGGYSVWHERIVSGIVGKDILSSTKTNIPFSQVDINTLLHAMVEGQPINNQALLNASLSNQLGISTPFSVSLVDDEHGTYLIRSEYNPPMFLSIFGTIPMYNIPYEYYKMAGIYLIENDRFINKK